MTDYRATINGTWNPGSIPAIEPAGYPSAQRAATDATRSALGLTGDTVDFHILSVKQSGGPVYRAHWKLFSYVSGPALHMGTTEPHDSQISLMLRVFPFSQVDQVRFDPDLVDADYRGVMAGVVPALLLRKHWGLGPRQITVGSLGTGTFTPAELTYPELFSANPQTTVPYDTPDALASYGFTLAAGSSPQPAMWLVDADDASWKVSYCAERVELAYLDRWDDPDEPAPGFDPLPAPNPVLPPPSYD